MVLDIGGVTGAAVLYTPASLEGREIEIRTAGKSWQGAHTAVRRRCLRGGDCFAAVFGALLNGCYEFRVRGTGNEPELRVVVPGGVTTEVTWPGAAM